MSTSWLFFDVRPQQNIQHSRQHPTANHKYVKIGSNGAQQHVHSSALLHFWYHDLWYADETGMYL